MASSPEKLGALLHSLETILKPWQRVCVCAAFLDRIHYLREAVELLATWPLNAYMVVIKYLDDEVNRDAAPQKSAAFCPREQICGDPEEAQKLVRERVEKSGDIVLCMGNGMLSYLHSGQSY